MKIISICMCCLLLASCSSHIILVRAPQHNLVEVAMRKQATKDEHKLETFINFGPGPGETL